MATTAKPVMGYLPNEQPAFGQMVLLGFQHVLTMFPATVLCALLMGFNVSTVLTVTGLGTIVALIGSKLAMGKYIPLYYGSSFSYIAAVTAITKAKFGEVAPDATISIVQAGFLATGLINVLVGLLIRVAGGKKAVDVVLPASITGPVACTIGIGLGQAALNNASGALVWTQQLGSGFEDQANGFAVDTSSGAPQLVTVGYTDGTLPGVPQGHGNPDASGATHNYFVMKCDADGNLVNGWQRQSATAAANIAHAVATDVSGNVYVAGETAGSIAGQTYAGGALDVFVAKYDASGNKTVRQATAVTTLSAPERKSLYRRLASPPSVVVRK